MTERIDDVLIVGGGDAGLLTALALQRYNPDLSVSVVDDFDREPPEIGKSTFLEMRSILHGRLGIDERRFVREVKPIWKASAWFRDWGGADPFHYPFDAGRLFPSSETPNAYQDYYYWYDTLHADPDHRTICEEIVDQGKSPWYYEPRQNNYDRYDRTSYHVDTGRFNAFLRDICREREIALINDAIVDVEVADGDIERVRSKSQTYEADLYVDATGFARVLVGELDREFRAFEMPLDSAFAAKVDNDLSEVVPATIHETGEHGWFWHIDTYDHLDLGYVYASDYVSKEEAREEFLAYCEQYGTPEDVAHIGFDTGYVRTPWAGNCIVVGNASGNVEALEATGLTFSAQGSVKLSRLLATRGAVLDDPIRERYNAWARRGWEAIYDFIAAHYRYVDPHNEFWADMTELPKSERMELLEEAYDQHGIDRTVDPFEDHPGVEGLEVFNHMDFYLIMRHLGVESSFYEDNDFEVSEHVKEKKATIERGHREKVEDFLTTEEFYETVVDLEGAGSGAQSLADD